MNIQCSKEILQNIGSEIKFKINLSRIRNVILIRESEEKTTIVEFHNSAQQSSEAEDILIVILSLN